MYCVDLESLEETVIYDDNVITLTINNGWIYFVTFDKEKQKDLPKYTTDKDALTAGTINKMKLDGSNEQIICTENINPYDSFLHIIGEWIYITGAYESETLRRIGPNGEDYSIVELPKD